MASLFNARSPLKSRQMPWGDMASADLPASDSVMPVAAVSWGEAHWDAETITAALATDSEAEAGADRLVETCAMWVFMGAMACAVVSLGFLVVPMMAFGY
ncbi:MAG: hypothetical protein Q7T70_14355 [Polaromonas sp.]|nr:hypothetical protein [Polaromonas sp.]